MLWKPCPWPHVYTFDWKQIQLSFGVNCRSCDHKILKRCNDVRCGVVVRQFTLFALFTLFINNNLFLGLSYNILFIIVILINYYRTL